MKIKAKYFTLGIIVFSLFSCSNGTESLSDYNRYDSSKYFRNTPPEYHSFEGTRSSSSSFDFEKVMLPINCSDFMYDEPIVFIGKDDEATLLYEPTEIHSVWNYAKTVEYREGVDFVVEGNKIRLTENSSMKYWDKSEYYKKDSSDVLHPINANGLYLRYSEGLSLKYEYVVTYSHRKNAEAYKTSRFQGDKLKNTLSKIQDGKTVNIAFLGDSITVGAGPIYYYESYVELVKNCLMSKCRSNFNFENISIGGKSSSAATAMVKQISFTPDLICVAFGMNDIFSTSVSYKNNIERCINLIHSKYPEAEILLISNMLPNPEIFFVEGNDGDVDDISVKESLEFSLYGLEEEYPYVALTPMTSISSMIFKAKRDCSVLSNNFNHPNNFLHRIYAQEILNTLMGDYYAEVN